MSLFSSVCLSGLDYWSQNCPPTETQREEMVWEGREAKAKKTWRWYVWSWIFQNHASTFLHFPCCKHPKYHRDDILSAVEERGVTEIMFSILSRGLCAINKVTARGWLELKAVTWQKVYFWRLSGWRGRQCRPVIEVTHSGRLLMCSVSAK